MGRVSRRDPEADSRLAHLCFTYGRETPWAGRSSDGRMKRCCREIGAGLAIG